MEINIGQNGLIELTKVYNSIELRTNDNETIKICMRDSGFEFTYEGEVYSAKEGVLVKVEKPKPEDLGCMLSNSPKGCCPECGSLEVDSMTPRTVYSCGSSDYDQRPNTFLQVEACKKLAIPFVATKNKSYDGSKLKNDSLSDESGRY